MSGSRYKALWLGRDLVSELERFIENELGLKPSMVINEVAKEGIRFALSRAEEFKEFMKPKERSLKDRFEHFNCYEDHVTLWDKKLGRLVDVYLRNMKAYCEFCKEFDCDHVKFAVCIPKVRKVLEAKGWEIPFDCDEIWGEE